MTGVPRWYWTVVYIPSPERWAPVVVHRTGEWIRSNVPNGAKVLTIDPIHPLEANVSVYPEFAVGRFPIHIGPQMNPESRARERIIWGDTLQRLLLDRPPDAIFVARRNDYMIAEMRGYAEQNGFRRLESPDGEYLLWVRPVKDEATLASRATRHARLP